MSQTLQELIIPVKVDKESAKQSINGLKTELSSLAGAVLPTLGLATAVTSVAGVMRDAVDETMAYAKEVRGVALATGGTVEEASRLIQVMDDYGVTADGLTKASKKLAEEGLAPSIDTIANLADQYNSLSTAQERTDLITQYLGKDTEAWHSVLSRGSTLLREQNDAVSEGNILTEDQIIKVREAEIAMDNWDDSMKEVKQTLAIGLMPALTDTLSVILSMSKAQGEQVKWWEYLVPAVGSIHTLLVGFNSVEDRAAISTQAHSDALAGLATEAEDARLALQGLDKEVKNGFWQQSGGFTYQGSTRPAYYGSTPKASGGAVIKGQTYDVAEFYRPETFTAWSSGRIDPMKATNEPVQAIIDEEALVRTLISAYQQGKLS